MHAEGTALNCSDLCSSLASQLRELLAGDEGDEELLQVQCNLQDVDTSVEHNL